MNRKSKCACGKWVTNEPAAWQQHQASRHHRGYELYQNGWGNWGDSLNEAQRRIDADWERQQAEEAGADKKAWIPARGSKWGGDTSAEQTSKKPRAKSAKADEAEASPAKPRRKKKAQPSQPSQPSAPPPPDSPAQPSAPPPPDSPQAAGKAALLAGMWQQTVAAFANL